MRVLVTGGAGYIGSHVNKLLASLGYETVVLDNLFRGHRELVKWGTFYEIDLLDKKALKDLLCDEKVEAVMHFAALAYVGESVKEPARYYENNTVGSYNLLTAMMEAGVENIVFSSTCAVYGDPEYVPMDETHPKKPVNPYGRSKLAVEFMLEDFAQACGLRYISLRYFNAAGADPDLETGEWHEPETHLIPNAIYTALGIRPYIEVFGSDYETEDGTCVRDFVHVSDLAKAHIKALEYLVSGGKSCALNLGTGRGYSVMEVINLVERLSGSSVKVKHAPRRQGDPPVLVANPGKAKEVIGWTPRYGIEDIIDTALRWYKKLLRLV